MSFLQLNIRQKIVLAFLLSLIASLFIGAVGYRQLVRIENKLQLVEVSNSFHNAILEVRRYEKNFLLYGLKADFQQALSYLERAEAINQTINTEFGKLKGVANIAECCSEMARYRQAFSFLASSGESGGEAGQRRAAEARLRESGKNLVDRSLQLTRFEQQRILEILHTLKAHLVYLFGVILCLGIFLTVLVTRQILGPLAVIEETTQKIARGDMAPLKTHQAPDETRAVLGAFNKMVSELEKRQHQLVQAQKLSSLGILTSGITHQLNNPLNNISTSCQILLEELDDGETELLKRLLTNINQEADRTRDIVKGLLDFSREHESQLGWINLDNIVIRSIRLVSSELPTGVEIDTDIPEDLDIYVDGQQLQEVFLNLLINSAQAMPGCSGKINISAQSDPEDPDMVEIRFEDSGIGIPDENLAHVFDPFFSTKEEGLGTGLGLSVVYGIIEQHGGSITVQSRPGEGTRFTIRLPRKDRDTLKEECT